MNDKIPKKRPDTKVSKTDPSNPLESVELSPEQSAGILVDAITGAIASSIPGFSKFFDWVERIDQASREEKIKTLFKEYTAHFESLDDAIARLKQLTATRGGQTLFRKIIQIIGKGAEDQEWISLLAIALQRISEAEFEKYFETQMFILSQIDRLSPQALIILSKYGIWKEVNIQNTTTTSGQTMGDWAPQVTMFIRSHMGIENLEVGGRINHSFRELESANILTLSGHQLKLTAIGLEIYRVIETK